MLRALGEDNCPALRNAKSIFYFQVMKPPPYSFFSFLFLLFCVPAIAQQKRPLAAKAPPWVTINQYNYSDTRLDHEAEDGYFNIEYEEQVSLAQQTVFYKRAIKILTEAGIQNSSEISVSFDPSYEQLTFHSIKIIRGNETINQLNLSKIKTIQQEKELNRYLYNGLLTSVLFLEDVRKGDIIEYSYTLRGFNPVFRGKYAGRFDLDFRIPVGSLYYKLVVPKERQVTIKNHNTDSKPLIQNDPNETTYEWKLSHVKPLHLQDNLPSWYDPYSVVMVSEYKSWKEVNDWAMDLFPEVNDISPSLQKKIAGIHKQYATEEEQILEAIRFVQDDIRYMGVEMGENSHKPGNPNKTFRQRFGDCKDKSYLLCTILNKLGIQASPVLISTSDKKTLTKRLPSPLVFDHVTVQTWFNNKQYWIDPTVSFQRGSLASISYPDYQCGLVIHENTDTLTMINAKEKGVITVKEVFDIPDMSGRATLAVTSQYTGGFADDVRNSFNNNSRYEMQKTYRDYYASYYEKITADSIQYTDYEKTGLITTREYYTINDLWTLKDGVKKATFDSYVINGIIKKPKDKIRDMPFALVWPVKYKEEIEINLPEDWSASQGFEKINTSSFSTTARFSFDGRKTIDLEYNYENLKDHVVPGDIKEYLSGLDSRDNKFSYELSYSVDGKSLVSSSENTRKANSYYSYIGLLILLIIGGVIWWTQRK